MMRIAISIGDPNGIGPEIALKAAAAWPQDHEIRPVLVGDRAVLDHYHRLLRLERPMVPLGSGARGIECVEENVLSREAFSPGRVCAEAGAATVAYVRRGVSLVQRGEAAAMVGCPHSEIAVNAAGLSFSGYPELIADLTSTPRDQVFMMLAAAGLRIAHVTLHQSVVSAVSRLTPELVTRAGRALDGALRQLGLRAPRIGVFGINPHAGENGLFGDEDEWITKPAVAALRAGGILADGPAGGDVLLANRQHDGYLAMLHDQGHVPIKLVSPRQASAVTIGAGILFSSVGHGSAHDIAGRGIAEAHSVSETLTLLAQMR
jgi:4-hydroxy-L-threonine phosphate dehydrogenase PdxA